MIDWNTKHEETLTFGGRLADNVASFMGSWSFIIIQTVAIIIWIILQLIAWGYKWDPYPFILLNLIFSVQAAYAAPIIMQSQNRQAERDRHQAEADFETNIAAKNEIEQVQKDLARMELEKLDKIIRILEDKSRLS